MAGREKATQKKKPTWAFSPLHPAVSDEMFGLHTMYSVLNKILKFLCMSK